MSVAWVKAHVCVHEGAKCPLLVVESWPAVHPISPANMDLANFHIPQQHDTPQRTLRLSCVMTSRCHSMF